VVAFGWKGRKKKRKLFLHETPLGDIPRKHSLEQYAGKVGNQGNEGSCVGWGFKTVYDVASNILGNLPGNGWSSRCAYNMARAIGNRLNSEGAFLTDLAQGVSGWGECDWNSMPYTAWGNDWNVDPRGYISNTALEKGRPKYYVEINSFNDIFKEIAKGNAVDIGIWWYSNWTQFVGRNLPKASGSPVGGHSVGIIAYDLDDGRVLIQNSWSQAWGFMGKAWMLIDDLKNLFNAGEFFIFKPKGNGDPEPPDPEPSPIIEFIKWLIELLNQWLRSKQISGKVKYENTGN